MSSRILLYALLLVLSLAVLARVRAPRLRQAVLLAASYVFYISWGVWFAGILLASTAMNFLIGRRLRREQSAGMLWTGIALNLALLGAFKYLPPAAMSLPFASLQHFSHLALPLGISFWTFQAMSYLFDLYRGEELDPSFPEFALYMAFFPVVISGPVCRLPEMLPQFRSDHTLRRADVQHGLFRIATGVLMMQLSQLLGRGILNGAGINAGFDQLTRWSGADVWCLAFGYGLQLFFDFAGYSHIAIGTARMLGFTLPENFARPFTSSTPSIFWTRWHMSLSFWIRDYVFLPLAVLRREVWWRNLALVIAMVLFGLWHGASLLFVIWGCYHGALLVLHRSWQQAQQKLDWSAPALLWTPLFWAITMGLISFGWIFFRARTLSQARAMLLAVLSPQSYGSHVLPGSLFLLVLILALGYAAVLAAGAALDRVAARPELSAGAPASTLLAVATQQRWIWLAPMYSVALLVAFWMVTRAPSAGSSPFLYRFF